MHKYYIYRSWYLATNDINANVTLRDLDLNFEGHIFQGAILTSKGWDNANTTIAVRWEIMYLPSNGITANVAYHDLELHFQGDEFRNVNISKTIRANEKCDFYRDWFFPSNTTIANIVLRDLELNFQRHTFQTIISRLILAIEWHHCGCFYSLNLNFIFKVKYLRVVHLL